MWRLSGWHYLGNGYQNRYLIRKGGDAYETGNVTGFHCSTDQCCDAGRPASYLCSHRDYIQAYPAVTVVSMQTLQRGKARKMPIQLQQVEWAPP